jgi:LmbE family N-acetylglucosaminyl deacetylase
LAPHPDDESIIGLLPLRLREECGFRVWVVPATLGSRIERQAARRRECGRMRLVGFGVRFLKCGPAPETSLAAILRALRPTVVFLPHARDGHPTHRAAHRWGVAAMDTVGDAFHVVETEYWHPLAQPNLMVAASAAR